MSLNRLSNLLAAVAALFFLSSNAWAELPRLWSELANPGQTQKVQTLPDFVDLAAKLSPAVVNISSEPRSETKSSSEDPFHEFSEPFERFPQRKVKSLGSGFV